MTGGEKMGNIDIKNYISTNDKGEQVIDYDKFNADLDRERTQASTTAREKADKELRKSIRDELEKEASLSAEEKVKAEREKLLEERKKFNEERIQAIYKDAGLSEDEMTPLLELVTDDAEKSLEKANKIASARKKYFEDYKVNTKKQLEKELALNSPDPNGASGGGKEENLGSQLAKKTTTTNKDDILKNYNQ